MQILFMSNIIREKQFSKKNSLFLKNDKKLETIENFNVSL